MKSTIISALIFCFSTFNKIPAQNYSFENVLPKPEIIDMKATPLNRCNCNNKATVPVKLPANAKGWFYSVTFTPKGRSLANEEELLNEVVTLSKEVSLDEIDDHINPLKTRRSSNIYIIRGKKYADSFNRCGFFYHHGKYIGTKSKSGYVENSEGETFYIGIERDSDLKGLKVKVEVVAVI